MDKEFVPYEQARTLKELGFDDSCLSYSYGNGVEFHNHRNVKNSDFPDDANELVTLPLYQQAFRWFKYKYRLHSFVDIYPTTEEPDRCWYMIRYLDRGEDGKEDYMSGWYENQDNVELGRLKRLIEIVKIDE